jgi:hypothetical protein
MCKELVRILSVVWNWYGPVSGFGRLQMFLASPLPQAQGCAVHLHVDRFLLLRTSGTYHSPIF